MEYKYNIGETNLICDANKLNDLVNKLYNEIKDIDTEKDAEKFNKIVSNFFENNREEIDDNNLTEIIILKRVFENFEKGMSNE